MKRRIANHEQSQAQRMRVPQDVAYVTQRLMRFRTQPGQYALHFTVDDRGIRFETVAVRLPEGNA